MKAVTVKRARIRRAQRDDVLDAIHAVQEITATVERAIAAGDTETWRTESVHLALATGQVLALTQKRYPPLVDLLV